MAAAIIGLVGAALGALITLLGGMLTERRQARLAQAAWRRDKRAEAYAGALQHMLRAANLRSEFLGGTGEAVLKIEHQREFFDDLVQAQFWLRTAVRYADASELGTLTALTKDLDTHVTRLISGVRFDQKDFSIWQVLQTCIYVLSFGSEAAEGMPKLELIDTPGADSMPLSNVAQIGMVSIVPMAQPEGHDGTAVTITEPAAATGAHITQINMARSGATVFPADHGTQNIIMGGAQSGPVVSAADNGASRPSAHLNIALTPDSPGEARRLDTPDAGGASAADSGTHTTDPVSDQPK